MALNAPRRARSGQINVAARSENVERPGRISSGWVGGGQRGRRPEARSPVPASPEKVEEALVDTLRLFVSPITARSAISLALKRSGKTDAQLEREGTSPAFLEQVVLALRLFLRDEGALNLCAAALETLGGKPVGPTIRSVTVKIDSEDSIVYARAAARDLAADVGFRESEQVKIATAVSELARNIWAYAGRGEILLESLHNSPRGVAIEARDEGPGIRDIDSILAGNYRSKTGLGLGLVGCRRLMDAFDVDSKPGKGTRVRLEKHL